MLIQHKSTLVTNRNNSLKMKQKNKLYQFIEESIDMPPIVVKNNYRPVIDFNQIPKFMETTNNTTNS